MVNILQCFHIILIILVAIAKVITGRVSFSAFQVPGSLWQGESLQVSLDVYSLE